LLLVLWLSGCLRRLGRYLLWRLLFCSRLLLRHLPLRYWQML